MRVFWFAVTMNTNPASRVAAGGFSSDFFCVFHLNPPTLSKLSAPPLQSGKFVRFAHARNQNLAPRVAHLRPLCKGGRREAAGGFSFVLFCVFHLNPPALSKRCLLHASLFTKREYCSLRSQVQFSTWCKNLTLYALATKHSSMKQACQG